MRLRKIVSGILIASTLSLSAPVFASPLPDSGMLEGDGGGFVGGEHVSTTAWILGLGALTLAVVAIVDSSKSP